MEPRGRASTSRPEGVSLLASSLNGPLPGEPLLLYVAATPVVVSAVIVTERDREDSKATRPDLPRVEVASGHAPVLFSELPPQAIENGGAPVPDSILPSQDVESGVTSAPISDLPPQAIENGGAPVPDSILPSQDVESGVASVPVSDLPPQDTHVGDVTPGYP